MSYHGEVNAPPAPRRIIVVGGANDAVAMDGALKMTALHFQCRRRRFAMGIRECYPSPIPIVIFDPIPRVGADVISVRYYHLNFWKVC